MKTDELITLLAQAPRPKKPMPLALALLALTAAAALITALTIGFRPDLGAADSALAVARKTMILAAAALAAGAMLDGVATPLPRLRHARRCAALAVFLFGAALGWDFAVLPIPVIATSLATPNFFACLLAVTLYGTAGSVVMLLLLRRYAPADTRRAGFAAGLAAAAAGAIGYSLHCPMDGATFIGAAYGLPVFITALIARALAPRLVRW